MYEGGSGEWVNIQKFKQDVQDAMKLTRDKAKSLITEIFDRIKKWYTVTHKSIKLLFRNQDKKMKKIVTKQDLIKVLSKVVRPLILTYEHVNAIIQVIGNVADETLPYERFCSAYFNYAN